VFVLQVVSQQTAVAISMKRNQIIKSSFFIFILLIFTGCLSFTHFIFFINKLCSCFLDLLDKKIRRTAFEIFFSIKAILYASAYVNCLFHVRAYVMCSFHVYILRNRLRTFFVEGFKENVILKDKT